MRPFLFTTMKTFFKDKFTYTHHCNLKMIGLISLPNYTNEIARLMSHTINAQDIWNKRLLTHPLHMNVWDIHSLKSLPALEKANYTETLQILNHSDQNSSITYTDTKGNVHRKKKEEVFFHIINHATYHRGQIMLALKNVGVQPIGLDYIHYYN